jgi:hypothetical protein
MALCTKGVGWRMFCLVLAKWNCVRGWTRDELLPLLKESKSK